MISVLMPIYNAESYLYPAIDSVLSQTFQNFELILIDDGSTDSSAKICKEFLSKDKRVRYIFHKNSGMAFSLNRGMKISKFNLIARFDSDDIMYPQRLQKQYDYFQKNNDIGILGSLGHYINSRGKIIGKTYSDVNEEKINSWYIPFNEPIGLLHPSVMFKKKLITDIGGYRGKFWPCEDIDLWNRAIENNIKIDVLQDFLIKYRLHSSSAISNSHMKNRKLYRWVRECMVLRRSNKKEISYNDFSKNYKFSLNRKRKDLSKFFYRNAGVNIREENHLTKIKGLTELAVSLILDPVYVSSKIFKQI